MHRNHREIGMIVKLLIIEWQNIIEKIRPPQEQIEFLEITPKQQYTSSLKSMRKTTLLRRAVFRRMDEKMVPAHQIRPPGSKKHVEILKTPPFSKKIPKMSKVHELVIFFLFPSEVQNWILSFFQVV